MRKLHFIRIVTYKQNWAFLNVNKLMAENVIFTDFEETTCITA